MERSIFTTAQKISTGTIETWANDIITYYHLGVIMTDRLSWGLIVTAAFYHSFVQKLRRKMSKNPSDLLRDGPLISHDNARPQLGKVLTDLLGKYGWEILPHPAYSLDRDTPDFDLFPKLKELVREQRFSSLEELSVALTQCIRQFNKGGDLTGIKDLPKRWNAIIQKHENYIEGL